MRKKKKSCFPFPTKHINLSCAQLLKQVIFYVYATFWQKQRLKSYIAVFSTYNRKPWTVKLQPLLGSDRLNPDSDQFQWNNTVNY